MLALIEEGARSRMEVEEWKLPTPAVHVRIYAPSQQADITLDREQVETLYSQLGRWLGDQNPFVTDVV